MRGVRRQLLQLVQVVTGIGGGGPFLKWGADRIVWNGVPLSWR